MSEGDDGPEITIDARRFAGVWANAIRVNGGHDEITMDFARLDPVEPRGMVVARVTCRRTRARLASLGVGIITT